MKKDYEKPELKEFVIYVEDIIQTSGGNTTTNPPLDAEGNPDDYLYTPNH